MSIDITFLQDTEHGGDSAQPAAIAQKLASFISAAQSSLHVAIYDFRLKPETAGLVVNALLDRARNNVEVEIAFDQGKPAAQTATAFAELGADAAPPGTGDFLAQSFPDGSGVAIQPIAGRKLMHCKYIVRDANTQAAAVWTGSTNWTDDAWSLQENNIVVIESPELASFYENDFQDLWVNGSLEGTGANDAGSVDIPVMTNGQVLSVPVDVNFAPGDGQQIDASIAALISSATERIKVGSMILSSHAILGALDDAIMQGQVAEFNGIYDKTQMDGVLDSWRKVHRTGLIATFEAVAANLTGKVSDRYSPTSKHNFMHNKVVVCDDSVVTGSFNFSKSATQNAENVLFIHDKNVADRYAEYIDRLIAVYSAQ